MCSFQGASGKGRISLVNGTVALKICDMVDAATPEAARAICISYSRRGAFFPASSAKWASAASRSRRWSRSPSFAISTMHLASISRAASLSFAKVVPPVLSASHASSNGLGTRRMLAGSNDPLRKGKCRVAIVALPCVQAGAQPVSQPSAPEAHADDGAEHRPSFTERLIGVKLAAPFRKEAKKTGLVRKKAIAVQCQLRRPCGLRQEQLVARRVVSDSQPREALAPK